MNEKLWEQLDLSDVNHMVEDVLGQRHMNFSDAATLLMQGEFREAYDMVKDSVISLCAPGVLESKNLFAAIILLGVFAMLLQYVFGVVKSRQVADLAYYFVYLLLVLLLLESFGRIMETAGEVLSLSKEFITILVPAYCLSISLAVGTVSAAVNYELVILLLLGIDYILAGLLLPLTWSYVFLAVMDGVDDRHRMKDFIKISERAISWGIKLCLSVTMMVSGVQNMITVQLDGMQKTVFQKAIGAIPGIGDMSETVTEVLTGSAGLIKNSVGTASVIFLFLLVLRPIWQVFCVSMTMKMAGACIRFMGQTRLSDIVSRIGEGGLLVMRTVMCGAISFCIVVAMTMFVLRGGR
nr:stage III sporulation protein AE [Lachnospiraceae bacterium]